jgi:hypothetical protein
MSQPFSRRKFFSMVFMSGAYEILAPQKSLAFFLPVHKSITEDALSRFSEAEIHDWERKLILLGVAAGDLVEGGLPLVPGSKYEPQYHFDNDFSYHAVIENFQSIAQLVDQNLGKTGKDPWGFGKILHAVQDFYSHSNYVPAYRAYRAKKKLLVASVPPIEQVFLNPRSEPGFLDELHDSIHTGRYPNHAVLPNDADHGIAFLPGPGMNNDLVCRKYYREAKVTALEATAWYLDLYIRKQQSLQDWKTLRSSDFVVNG